MSNRLDAESPKVPSEARALARLRRHIEAGEFEEVSGALPGFPRYLVTRPINDPGARTSCCD